MIATRQKLHSLVDLVDESGLTTLYNVMVRFITEDSPMLDEVTAHLIAAKERERGEVYKMEEIEWDR